MRELRWYFGASFMTACLDVLLVFAINSFVNWPIVITNSISVTSTTIIHYLLISKIVFRVKLGMPSLIVYFITFMIGLAIQDLAIWVCFEVLDFPLLVSKGVSLGSSFFILFFLRKVFFGKIRGKEKRSQSQV